MNDVQGVEIQQGDVVDVIVGTKCNETGWVKGLPSYKRIDTGRVTGGVIRGKERFYRRTEFLQEKLFLLIIG
ncbi:MAG: hypothetical protein GY757_10115 [bacterium]|nr:hypothetical protein [bacterium]